MAVTATRETVSRAPGAAEPAQPPEIVRLAASISPEMYAKVRNLPVLFCSAKPDATTRRRRLPGPKLGSKMSINADECR